MVYIKKLPKKKKVRPKTEKREIRNTYYQSNKWKKLRNGYIMTNCLCELCMLEDKTTPAEDIHHIVSPFQEGVDTKYLFFNSNNLMALCKNCHGTLHSNKKEQDLWHIFYDREKNIL